MTKFGKLVAPALASAVALAATMTAQARDTGRGFNQDAPSARSMGRATSRNMHDYRPVAIPTKRIGKFRIRADIRHLQREIERAAAWRKLSWREAASLRRDANRLERSYWRYSRNGLSRREASGLRHRIARLRVALRIDMRDRDGRRG
ncbi:MAG: hypothetical protein P8J20_18445 [Novosphingobium sp.]|nr:hypothetical protein [Novosphingobium sp.]